jgi:hypothetical protein
MIMAKTKKIRLSGPQLETLRSLPRRMHDQYKPIRHLVSIGFATEIIGGLSQNSYEITPAGTEYLTEADKK